MSLPNSALCCRVGAFVLQIMGECYKSGLFPPENWLLNIYSTGFWRKGHSHPCGTILLTTASV